MSENNTTLPGRSTQWQAIVSLGILHAVFVFGNLAYDQNQTVILEKHGLGHFAHGMEWWAMVLGLIVPPVAGWLSDRYAITRGKRYLVITAAVVVTAMLFLAVGLGYAAPAGSGITIVLPFLMVIWIAGMHFFHSPTHSFVREYAPSKSWPVANAVILLIGTATAAFGSFYQTWIARIGTTPVFIAGGFLLVMSAWWFVRTGQSASPESLRNANFAFGKWWMPLAFGMVSGLVVQFFFKWLDHPVAEGLKAVAENPYGMPVISIGLAVAGIFAGRYAGKVGTTKVFRIALPVFVLIALAGYFAGSLLPWWLLLIVFGLAFTALRVCCLPMALRYVENSNGGFMVGVYWTGFFVSKALGGFW